MRVVALALAVAAASCGPEPVVFRIHSHEATEKLARVGAVTAFVFYVNTPGGDRRQRAMPVDPTCAARSPEGIELPCEVRESTEIMIDEDNGVVIATFTPAAEGWNEVTVTLQEGGAITGRALALPWVDRQVAELPLGCGWVDQLSSGAWLCDSVFLRPGEPPQNLYSERVAGRGAVVWALNAGELQRFEDLGTGPLVRSSATALDTGVLYPTRLLATEAEVVILDSAGLVRIAVDSQRALHEVARVRFPGPGRRTALRVGDVVLTAEDGSYTALRDEAEFCTFVLSTDGIVPGPCRTYPGWPLGDADGGLWLLPANFAQTPLLFVTPALGEPIELPFSSLVSPPGYSGPQTGAPVLGGGVVPRFLDGAPRYQQYPIGGPGSASASDTLTWTSTATGHTLVFER